jgi:hypothetical protein
MHNRRSSALLLESVTGGLPVPRLAKAGAVVIAAGLLLDLLVHTVLHPVHDELIGAIPLGESTSPISSSCSGWCSSSSASSSTGSIHSAGRSGRKGLFAMPFGEFVNQIPPIGFLAIHIALFAIGAFFAWRSFGAGATTLGAGFSLFALAELVYMTYHLDWTTFLFARTISEVLNVVAFGLIFVAATRTILGPTAAASRA